MLCSIYIISTIKCTIKLITDERDHSLNAAWCVILKIKWIINVQNFNSAILFNIYYINFTVAPFFV